MNVKAIVTVIVICLMIHASASADDVSKFQYNPQKARTGVLYLYLKTNHDGTNPENIAVYAAARDRLEVFKYREAGARAALVIAWMDWSIFSATKLESYQVMSAEESTLIATMDYAEESQTATVKLLLSDIPPESAKISHLPFHIYNFDFSSLNFAFRHLKNPKEPFAIEVADLVTVDEKWRFISRGTADLKYVGDETVHGQSCRKYSIDGKGLENRGGHIWINMKEGHAEKMQIDLPDNPDWINFLLELKETRSLSADQWLQFRRDHFATAK